MSIVIIGTGFAGIGMAIRLKQSGIDDFVILEKADAVGGTWRENRYPGCACDVQSHLYSFSFEPNPDWSRMFAPQAEILQYINHCAEKYGVLPHVRFGRRVTRAAYDEDAASWRIDTEAGERFDANVLIAGLGALHKPSIPGLPGRDDFAGPAFHSARWDHACDLRGKRVAVVGTGASAIQFAPEVAKEAAQVDIYQRSPPWILPKEDRPIADWEKRMFRAMPSTQRMWRERIYWKNESRVVGLVMNPKLMTFAEKAARGFLEREVSDPELRARLTPDYLIGCKRILLSNNWYQMMCRDNVSLVTDGIEQITPGGLRTADGTERPADVIIYGTGFVTQVPVPPGAIIGRGGRDLGQEWTKRPQAYKGATVAGFPNLYFLGGPNTSLGHSSIIYMHEAQITYVLGALKAMREGQLRALEVTEAAQADYNAQLHAKTDQAVWQTGCESWYVNEDGVDTVNWPDFTFRFRKQMAKFDQSAYTAE